MAWADVVQWFRNSSSATQEPSMRALANGMLELTKQLRRMDRQLGCLDEKLESLRTESPVADADRDKLQPGAAASVAKHGNRSPVVRPGSEEPESRRT